LEKGKLKSQGDVTTDLAKQLKLKGLSIPSADKVVKKQMLKTTDVNASWYSFFGKQFSDFL
jgi:hypothetical protein